MSSPFSTTSAWDAGEQAGANSAARHTIGSTVAKTGPSGLLRSRRHRHGSNSSIGNWAGVVVEGGCGCKEERGVDTRGAGGEWGYFSVDACGLWMTDGCGNFVRGSGLAVLSLSARPRKANDCSTATRDETSTPKVVHHGGSRARGFALELMMRPRRRRKRRRQGAPDWPMPQQPWLYFCDERL